MIINANAKINVTLDILGVRPDGYHALRSVMVPVSLCDEIHIETADSLVFDCDVRSLVTEDNLCVRAAKAFFEKAKLAPKVSIKLVKRIPFPAGLGGGSSDAAAVLRGLNNFFGAPLSDDELFEIAASLGSDINVCLLGSPALCEGRGEILTPLLGVKPLNVLIAIGKGRLPTPQVYRNYDAATLEVRDDSTAFIKAVNADDFMGMIASFGNAFEPVTDEMCPETKQIRELMLANGALTSHLSGSGPSVYGVFEDQSAVAAAAQELRDLGFSAYECVTLQ